MIIEKYIFISGIPASGKSYLAQKIAKDFEMMHVDVDDWREEMTKDINIKRWVNFFFDKDEKKYWQNTTCEKHWQNLVKQSEAFWEVIIRKINKIIEDDKSSLFEGVNILPHLAAKDLKFPGIFLLGESFETILERNKKILDGAR